MSIRLKLTIMFLAIASIPLLLVSALTFTNYKNSLEANRFSQLRDLTILRADRIEAYFAGLKVHIEIAQGFYNIKKNFPVLTLFADDPNNPEFLAAKKMLDEQLQQMQSVSDLSDIMLVNPQGKVVFANKPEHYSKDLSNGYDAEQKAFTEGKNRIYYSDVYFDKAEDNRFEILLTAPAYDFNDAFIGVIAFEVDMTPAYKLIQDTTGLGKTGETLIGKKIGNQVLFLNPLRHDPQAALTRTITIGDKIGYPMQEAVQGRTGFGQQIDYRGEKNIAAWQYIPSLDWGLVAKIDTKEAFADVTNLKNLAMITLVIVFVLSGVIAFSIAQSISEPIKRLSKGAEIIGSGNLDYKIETNLKDEIGQLSRSFDKMTHDLKQTTTSRDKLNREITEREKKEQELYKLNRTLRALSNSIQAMMQATDESEYLEKVCNIVVRDCGHVMSWVGFAEDDENKTVRPVTNAGFEQGYLETLNITWADTERGRGPTGMAIRTGKPSMCRNMPTDPAFKPWRQDAIKRGYASSIALPLISDGKTFGALTIYSREPDPFSDDEVNLLTELADDLAYGIAAIRLRIAHTQAEEVVRKSRDELVRSNKELEQFAYVASHDLQEPLRMIAGYTQLLQRRYKDKIDEDANQFIFYTVDGVLRMQTLINDLLAYSRLEIRGKVFEPVDCQAVLDDVLVALQTAIEENSAVITHGPLPTIQADRTQLFQLFQNLIGNAIKFRGDKPPLIHIAAEPKDDRWLFSVSDNGIGIDPQYAERIFVIFQRLHSRDKYSGTGIGLAICKKIVERHGGKIWVKSESGKGSTFYFII